MAETTEWVLEARDPDGADLMFWDRLHGNDRFIRLDKETGEAYYSDYHTEERKINLARFLCDVAHGNV